MSPTPVAARLGIGNTLDLCASAGIKRKQDQVGHEQDQGLTGSTGSASELGRLVLGAPPSSKISSIDRDASVSLNYEEWTIQERSIFERERQQAALWRLDRPSMSIFSTKCAGRVFGQVKERICQDCCELKDH
jgi:hypothetical protein